MSRQLRVVKVSGNAGWGRLPEQKNNGKKPGQEQNFTETLLHSGGDLTISLRQKQTSQKIKSDIKDPLCTTSYRIEESEQSDSDSSYNASQLTNQPSCHPFSLLPPVTKEVITFMEAILQYMKEVYKEENESNKPPSNPEVLQVPNNFKLDGVEKVEVYPKSRCYISKSKMSAILLSADEEPENWIKLTRAILEEVYGRDLAHLSAKGTRRSQGIYVPLYNAIYALINDRLRLINKRVSEHEFNKRINKICSNKRGAAKRMASTASCSSSTKPSKYAKDGQDSFAVSSNNSCTEYPSNSIERVPVAESKLQRECHKQSCQAECICDEEDVLEGGVDMVPVDIELGGAEQIEVFPNSNCYISKSKMYAILLSADEDPENWIKLTRAILEEVYGEDLANLSAKGTRGSQGISAQLYNALYALVNDRLLARNKYVSEHEFNKRINKICSNKRGAAKRAARRSVTMTVASNAATARSFKMESDDESCVE